MLFPFPIARLNLELLLSCPSSLGQLIKIIRQTQMETVVDKLIVFSVGSDEELRDISALGASLLLDFF